MMRTQIQMTPQQGQRLRRLAHRHGVSMSEIVRRCIDETLAREEPMASPEDRARAALAVCGKYEDPRGSIDVSEQHDRHLARAFAR